MDSLLRRVQEQGPAKTDYMRGISRASTVIPDSMLCFSHPRIAGPGRAHHGRFIILQNFAGNGVVCLDNNIFPFGEGDILVFFPFQYHNYLDIDDSRGWLFISFEMQSHEHLEPLRNRVTRTSLKIQNLTSSVLDDFNKVPRKEGRRASRMALSIALILEECLRSQETMDHDELQRLDLNTRLDVLRRLQRLIFEWIDRPVSIEDLATELHISEPHLRFLFRREFGISLGRHIRDVKMSRASNLLATTDMPISEIGEKCGYDTVYAFSRAFKALRKVPPSVYRRNQ